MKFKTLKGNCLKIGICIPIAALSLTFSSCKLKTGVVDKSDVGAEVRSGEDWFAANAKLTKVYDEVSNTTYYLIRINHEDTNGKLIKLRMDFANKIQGEATRFFAVRKGAEVAINASMGLKKSIEGVTSPVGVQIIDGVIKQELKSNAYTLGIKNDNTLVSYAPGTSAKEMLRDGSVTALTAFVPLILDHEFAPDIIFKVAGNLILKHPRQVVAQFENKDILFLSCGGRGFDGEGMTAKDLMRILKALDVRFAFNLDGGGSVSTAIGERNINKLIDGKGTIERQRPNFLYVKKN